MSLCMCVCVCVCLYVINHLSVFSMKSKRLRATGVQWAETSGVGVYNTCGHSLIKMCSKSRNFVCLCVCVCLCVRVLILSSY